MEGITGRWGSHIAIISGSGCIWSFALTLGMGLRSVFVLNSSFIFPILQFVATTNFTTTAVITITLTYYY